MQDKTGRNHGTLVNMPAGINLDHPLAKGLTCACIGNECVYKRTPDFVFRNDVYDGEAMTTYINGKKQTEK